MTKEQLAKASKLMHKVGTLKGIKNYELYPSVISDLLKDDEINKKRIKKFCAEYQDGFESLLDEIITEEEEKLKLI